MPSPITISRTALDGYPDVYTPGALATLEALASLDGRRLELMDSRIDRRRRRAAEGEHLSFLPETAVIDGTTITVADARAGRFEGAVIPHDLQRQWIQGTGPATRPRGIYGIGVAQCCLRVAVWGRRLDVRWRGRLGPGRHHVSGQHPEYQAGLRRRPAVP